MSLGCFASQLDLSSSLIPCCIPSITRHDLRRRRRRRVLEFRCQFGIESLFNTLTSVPPLDLVAPVVGLASVAAGVYLHRFLRPPGGRADAGEWILFTSPTPFNRCVIRRCPSVSFEDGSDIANSLNDWLVREERHYIIYNRDRVLLKDEGDAGFDMDFKFQRICVRTDDGGVISIDWPDYLDLEREQGLDTTVLIIPGTPEGSMNNKVRLFVLYVIKHGCFPIVMNPRGCAGSALTTARLFTAADSDDVCTAVGFVNKVRPWTTLMVIGLGYGANMLTKYLAEIGERTPVTAAVCIDTPFDLNESTKSQPHCAALDKKMILGLREILLANKELFQGKSKGFEVAKALSATSVCDFDEAISMISHGFDSLEEFYQKSSTRQVIDKLKIPVLFIQSDDGTVPLFSIPRNSITDNPFTSLLLCSCARSTSNRDAQSALLWSQQLAIEWLSAVEFALLRGRHPLLNDVDITIKPSKGPKFGVREKPVSAINTINGFLLYPLINEDNGDGGALYDKAISHRKSGSKFNEMERDDEVATEASKNEKHNTTKEIQIESVENATSCEGNQITQTATVIMNMLDVTMPGTLNDEQKKKVLSAMDQGETFMKALQEAVPDDVRGKITTAVAEILQTQGSDFNLESIKRNSWIPNVTSELKSMIQAKIKGSPSMELGYDDDPLEQEIGKSDDIRNEENFGSSEEKDEPSSVAFAAASGMEEEAFEKKNCENQVLEDDMNNTMNEMVEDPSSQSTLSSSINFEESSLTHSLEQQMQGEENESQKNDEKSNQHGVSKIAEYSSKSEPSSSKPHYISVSQALNALTGFDDSTQMAVNSVFGVIENMIDQLEKNNLEEADEVKICDEQRSTKVFNDSSVVHEEKSNISSLINNNLENPLHEGGIESYEDIKDKLDYNKVNISSSSSSEKSNIEANHLSSTKLRKHRNTIDLTLDEAMKRYWLSPYVPYLLGYSTPLPKLSSLDVQGATDLFLDPEEGQWKMKDQPSSSIYTADQYRKDQNSSFALRSMDLVAIEPSYTLLDGDHSKIDNELLREEDDIKADEQVNSLEEKLYLLIKSTLLDNLKVEVCRRINVPVSDEFDGLLAYDLENFADKVSQAVVSCSVVINSLRENISAKLVKFGIVEGCQMVEIILSALQDASRLRKVVPSGVIVGSSLASLRTYFEVVDLHNYAERAISRPVNKHQRSHGQEIAIKDVIFDRGKIDKVENAYHQDSKKLISHGNDKFEAIGSTNGCIMVGAVTTALGASALLANRQKKLDRKDDIYETHYSDKRVFSGDESMQEKYQNNLVSCLAEKAMSVAGPVMPTKSDGEVDHERLVAILSELGQKGGILRLVGKVALLYGGLRGAMSLTDRLITFLHIAERPLFQRVFGFVCMVLVLWSPVVLPLLPTLVQSWTTHNPNRIAEFTCIVGLYIAALILIILWGKRIRGYDNPLKQYGLDFTSASMVFDFLKGLIGGIIIISCIHLAYALLGYASFTWTKVLPSSSGAVVFLRACGNVLLLTVQGIVSATGISIVEELLFRSWLAEEVAVDLGYYHAMMISGIIFALFQRSLPSMPAFLLLSISLFGIKQRANGKLTSPIGIRAGMMAANLVIQNTNLLSYRAGTPFWLASPHPWHPFDGAVGIGLCAMLAISFFPHKLSRPIRE